jgi:ABC-type glycerol-3-phosphate transport system substrate-binding protein
MPQGQGLDLYPEQPMEGADVRRMFLIVAMAAVTLAACSSSGSKSSSSTTAAPAAGGTIKLSGSFCADSTSAQQNNLSLGSATDPASLKKDVDLLKKFASEAPSAIKGDVNTLVNAYTQIATALGSANNDPAKMAAALAPLQGEQAQLQTASQHITAYVASHCH